MTLRGWIEDKLGVEKKQSRTFRGITALYTTGQPQWTTEDYVSWAREGYQKNTYVYACVHKIAWACAGIPLLVYEKVGDKLVEQPEHPLKLLLARPNPYESGVNFTVDVFTSLMLSGNAYIERVGPTSITSPPKELYCLRPDRMLVKPGNATNYVSGYQYNTGSSKIDFPPEQILHLKLYNPTDDWYGQSPMKAALVAIDMNNEAHSFDVAMLQNMACPSGALTCTENLTDEQKKELKDGLKTGYSRTKAFNPLVLDGGMDWKTLSWAPTDMNWTDAMNMSAREIATCFSIPSELVGDSSQKTYSNFREARQAFYTETILPYMDWFIDELNHWLTPAYGDNLTIVYDTDSIEALQANRQEVWQRTTQAVMTGVLTINEARELMGYPVRPEGDILLISSAFIPVTSTETGVKPSPVREAPSRPAEESIQDSTLNSKPRGDLAPNAAPAAPPKPKPQGPKMP